MPKVGAAAAGWRCNLACTGVRTVQSTSRKLLIWTVFLVGALAVSACSTAAPAPTAAPAAKPTQVAAAAPTAAPITASAPTTAAKPAATTASAPAAAAAEDMNALYQAAKQE